MAAIADSSTPLSATKFATPLNDVYGHDRQDNCSPSSKNGTRRSAGLLGCRFNHHKTNSPLRSGHCQRVEGFVARLDQGPSRDYPEHSPATQDDTAHQTLTKKLAHLGERLGSCYVENDN
jgi:hypothetical protein